MDRDSLPTPGVKSLHRMSSTQIDGKEIILEKIIGKGKKGDVFAAIYRNNLFAVKKYHALENKSENIQEKISLYEKLPPSSYLIKYCGIISDPYKGLVMEYADNGTLQERLKKPPKVDKISLFDKSLKEITRMTLLDISQQIINGLYHLHRHDLIHGKLNTSHIFLDRNFKVKLGGLGNLI